MLVNWAKGHKPLEAGEMVLLLVITIICAPLALPLMLPQVQVDAVAIAQDLSQRDAAAG